jgi:hypothetical protein
MPDLYRVALYWSQWPEFFELDLDAPECFRCAIVVALDETKTQREIWREASHYLQRAHLADRYWDGLDGPQNLIPLCVQCHRYMPSFDNGDDAIRWAWKLWRYNDWDTRPIPQRIIRDPEAEDEAPLLVGAAGQGLLF